MSDLQHEFVRSYVVRFSDLDLGRLTSLVSEMIAAGDELLDSESVPADRREHKVWLDLRYVKQYHEVTVAVPREVLESGDESVVASSFHTEHNRLYGYDLAAEGTELELINIRVRSVGHTEKPTYPSVETGGSDPADALVGERRAYVPELNGLHDIPVYDGLRLRGGHEIAGAALIDRPDTTILVSNGYRALIDATGSARLVRKHAATSEETP